MLLGGVEIKPALITHDEPPAQISYWRSKGGKLIKISNMSSTYLINTINMLYRQIDGSAHDDFCWDNINAMENELRKRGINHGKDHKR